LVGKYWRAFVQNVEGLGNPGRREYHFSHLTQNIVGGPNACANMAELTKLATRD
jgi:hypothetical protein